MRVLRRKRSSCLFLLGVDEPKWNMKARAKHNERCKVEKLGEPEQRQTLRRAKDDRRRAGKPSPEITHKANTGDP